MNNNYREVKYQKCLPLTTQQGPPRPIRGTHPFAAQQEPEWMELTDVDGGGLQTEAEVLGDPTAYRIHCLSIPTCAGQCTGCQ